MSILKNYFKQKIKAHQNSSDRDSMANREIYTIDFLFKNFYDIKIFNYVNNCLDLGSGDKFLKKGLESKNIHYTGLDIQDCNFDTDNLPINDNSIDFIISLAVIEHIKNIDHFLSEIKRVLKKGAYLYLTTPNWHYSYRNFYDDPTHHRPFTPMSLKNLLVSYNFSEIQIFPGLRAKSKWWYQGKYSFFKSNYLIPFRKGNQYIPSFLKGRSTSIISIGKN